MGYLVQQWIIFLLNHLMKNLMDINEEFDLLL